MKKSENPKRWWLRWKKDYASIPGKDGQIRGLLFLPILAYEVDNKTLDTEEESIWVRISPMEIESIMEYFGYKRMDQ